MKIFSLITYTITGLLLIYLTRRTSFKKNALMERTLHYAFICAFITNIAYILLLTNGGILYGRIIFSIVAISLDWAIFFLMEFCLRFVSRPASPKPLHNFIRIALVADSILLFINIFIPFAFNVIIPENEFRMFLTYVLTPSWYYIVHLIICYSMGLFALVSLLLKLRNTSRIYWSHFFWIALMLILLIFWDIFCRFVTFIPNITITGCSIAGVIAYHLMDYTIPKGLNSTLLSLVSKEINQPIFFFGADNNCLFLNDWAENLFPSAFKTDSTKVYFLLRDYLHTEQPLISDFSDEITVTTDYGDKKYYRVDSHTFRDNRDYLLGHSVILTDQTESKKQMLQEQYRANHDSLTDAYNRDYFHAKCRKMLDRYPDEDFLMITSDIKDFKMINDILGAEQADKVLVRIADILFALCKDKDVFGRIGGDRFALLMPAKGFSEDIFIRNSTDMIHFDGAISYPVNIYFGVYRIDDKNLPIPIMCDRATMACNSIKGTSANRIAYYTESIRYNTIRAQQLSAEMDIGIRRKEFKLYLQAQITPEREVPGAEVLIRWEHPTEGLLAPGAFIEIFEQNGMIAKLDYYIWEQACEVLRDWKSRGIDMYLSVNISPKDFLFYNLFDVFTDLVQKYEISPDKLRLEITETAIISNLEKTLTLITKLQDYGFIIEMDDFGSGYSSLNSLKDIPVDILKVDLKFLETSRNQEKGRIILKSVLGLARDLGLPVITEGVETEDQVVFLRENGTNLYQGYYFARPIPLEKFEKTFLID